MFEKACLLLGGMLIALVLLSALAALLKSLCQVLEPALLVAALAGTGLRVIWYLTSKERGL